MSGDARIEAVAERDLGELLPLMRAYCEFYEVSPPDERLLAMSRALIADPEREGVQLIAREAGGRAAGFATVFWSWQTLDAGRVGVMNDLFVEPHARGSGLGAALIEACAERARAHGARALVWETALDNVRAQKVYATTGAKPSRWLSYELTLASPAAPSSSAQPE